MLSEIISFRLQLDTAVIAGACLWSLALYLSLSSLRGWITEELNRWFNQLTFIKRIIYYSY